MGRLVLILRLAKQDMLRRRGEVLLLVLAMTAATMTLTLGLVLHGVTDQAYQRTRLATSGPDVVAVNATTRKGATTAADFAAFTSLISAPGVRSHSGPFPIVFATLRTHDLEALVRAEGRNTAVASIDQPTITKGSWVTKRGIVVERTFANALHLHPGQTVTLNGRTFPVVGIAVTAALPPYPETCWDGCPPQVNAVPGTIWLTKAAARSLATPAEPLTYTLNLRLDDPSRANVFANPPNSSRPSAPSLESWQEIRDQDGNLIKNERLVMLTGSWLLALLAVATMAILVGARLARQLRRVGLLKAVGGTPGLIAVVFMIEYLTVAVLATAVGLLAGRLIAPLLARPDLGLLGQIGGTHLSLVICAIVLAAALAVAIVASALPVVRSARTSTVRALADSPRPPLRRAKLTAVTARLPPSLLVGARLIARRPLRTVLSGLSIFLALSGIVAVMATHATIRGSRGAASSINLDAPNVSQANLVLLYVTILLVVLAVVNVTVISRATVLDSTRSCALQRALGATPNQVVVGLALVQLLPASIGTIAAFAGGIGLAAAVTHGTTMVIPSWAPVAALAFGAMIVVTLLTVASARTQAAQPVAKFLRSN